MAYGGKVLRRAAALAALTVATTSIAACSSSGGASGPESFDPAAAARALKAGGGVRVSGEAVQGKRKVPYTLDIDSRSGKALGALPFMAGDRLVRVGYRRDGATSWFERVPNTGIKGIALGPDLLATHGAGVAPWAKIETVGPGPVFVTTPYDPAALFSALAKVRFRAAKTADVGGETRKGFGATVPVNLGRQYGVRALRVWPDAKGVPVAVEVSTPDNLTTRYTVERRTKRVDVRPPPDKDVEQPKALPTASGPYAVVATGPTPGGTYQVLRAPGSDGGTCWKVEATPPYEPMAPVGKDGGYCIPPIGTGKDDDVAGFPIDAAATTPYEMIGFLVPPGTTGDIELADQSHRPLPVDASGLGLFVGPSEPPAALATLTLPDGRQLYCAPGNILGPDDVRQLDPDEASNLSGQPWNCLFAADL